MTIIASLYAAGIAFMLITWTATIFDCSFAHQEFHAMCSGEVVYYNGPQRPFYVQEVQDELAYLKRCIDALESLWVPENEWHEVSLAGIELEPWEMAPAYPIFIVEAPKVLEEVDPDEELAVTVEIDMNGLCDEAFAPTVDLSELPTAAGDKEGISNLLLDMSSVGELVSDADIYALVHQPLFFNLTEEEEYELAFADGQFLYLDEEKYPSLNKEEN